MVRYAPRCDRPDVIGVRAGRFGRLLLIIPVGEVAEILPEEKLVVLHRSPRPTGTERRRDLREPLGRRTARSREQGRWKASEPEPSTSKPNGRWRR